jgi:hypothetical protein
MKVTPYTTETGLQIGCRYTPPPHTPTPEEISIQSVLLGDRQGDIPQTLAIIITAVIVVFLIASAVIKGVA